MFHPLRDPQLQFKSEKYKLNKIMEDIIKYNIKKINNKNPSHSKTRNKTSYLYAYFYTKCKTFNF